MYRKSKISTCNPFPMHGYRNFLYDEGNGSEPGGGSGGGPSGGSGPTGTSKPTGFQIETGPSIWDASKPTGQTSVDGVVAPVTPTPTGGQNDAMVQFDKRIADMSFAPLQLDEAQVATFFDNRDISGLNDHIHTGLRDVYRKTMIDSVRMMNTMQENIMAKMRTEAQNVTDQSSNIAALRAALPFTQNPNVSPIADAALQTQLSAGKNVTEAIATVREFFKQTAQISAKDLGFNLPPTGDPGSTDFRQGAEEEEVDWTHLLSGGVKHAGG